MKRDLTALVKAVEKKFGQSVTMATDFEKLAFAFARQHVTLHPTALKRLWMQLSGAEKPSVEILDKVALFVGFQSWKAFKDALRPPLLWAYRLPHFKCGMAKASQFLLTTAPTYYLSPKGERHGMNHLNITREPLSYIFH